MSDFHVARIQSALQRARTKTFVRMIKPFRGMFRNQGAVNDSLIEAVQHLSAQNQELIDQMEELRELVASLRSQLRRTPARDAAEEDAGKLMRILVATVRTPFVQGGAETLVDELVKALIAEGHQAEAVAIPFNPADPERIPDQMLACRLMDLREIQAMPIERLIAMKFPAYLIPHPNKVVWLMHQHRAAYDLWEHPLGDLRGTPRGRVVRDVIRRGDQQIARGSARHLHDFAHGHGAAARVFGDRVGAALSSAGEGGELLLRGNGGRLFFLSQPAFRGETAGAGLARARADAAAGAGEIRRRGG